MTSHFAQRRGRGGGGGGGWTIPFFILFVAALAALAHGDSAAAAALFLVFKLADLASLSLAEGEQARELAIPLDSECREQSHFSSNTRWC